MEIFNSSTIEIGDIKADILFSVGFQNIDSISTKLHFHSFIECHILNSGECDIITKDKIYHMKPGIFYIIPSMTPHTIINNSAHTEKICFSYNFQYLKNKSPKLYNNLGEILVGNEVCVAAADALHSILFENPDYNNEIRKYKIKSVATLLIIHLIENYKNTASDTPIQPKTKSAEFDFMNKVENYVYENYMNDISLKSLSNYLHISERQINRKLKYQTNVTFKDILTKHRMNVAINLLQDASIKISDIPQKVGFKSYTGFYYSVKQFFGKTPEEIRNL